MDYSNVTTIPPTLFSHALLNQTENITYVEYSQRIETYAAPICFAIIFLVGLLGNGTLVMIFIRNRSMRNVPNTYIISLATGDLMVITVTVPFISTIYVFESWPYGLFICKLSEFLRDLSIGVTVFTLTALSAERYIAIVKPVRMHLSDGRGRDTIIIASTIWILAILLATPSAYFSHVRKFPTVGNSTVSICFPFPQDYDWYPKASVISRFVVFYSLPLLCISMFYVMMAVHLYASSKKAIGETMSVVMINGRRLPPGQTKHMLERKKVAKIVLTFVLIFAGCFLPNHIYMIWFYFNKNSLDDYNDFWHAFKIFGFLLMFTNSCINPIALYFLSAAFRKYFNRYIFCCCEHKSPTGDRDTMSLRKSKQHSTMTNASAVSYL